MPRSSSRTWLWIVAGAIVLFYVVRRATGSTTLALATAAPGIPPL